ncbi:MAG: hypothetical protein ACE363_16300 [Alphaproteobacteria bacterium]
MSLLTAFALVVQGIVPMGATMAAAGADASELLSGKIAICSPFGVSYVDVAPGEPAPVQPASGPCVDCCGCVTAAIPVPGGDCGCAGFGLSGGPAEAADSLGAAETAFRDQAPRAPPSA